MKNNVLPNTLLGIGTGLYLFMPIISVGLWFLTFPVMIFSSTLNNSEPPMVFFVFFALFMGSILVSNLLHFIIVPTYIVLLLRNNNAQEIFRIILGIMLFFLPFIAAPIYYLVYILPAVPPAWALQVVSTPTALTSSGESSLD